MRKIIAVALCLMIVMISACSPVSGSKTAASAAKGDTLEHEICAGAFPDFLSENFDEETVESFRAYEKAVLKGETEFVCTDDSMDVILKLRFLSHFLMPVAERYAVITSISPDGTAHLQYGTKEQGQGSNVLIQVDEISAEEYMNKLNEFKDLTAGILNETCKAGYSDTEKALALYQYFVNNYKYDMNIKSHYSYGLLTEGTGICQDIAGAYAFLLNQAGVEAFICTGMAENGYSHEWVIARLEGKYYHIDPTFGLDHPDSLCYFGMTDDQRNSELKWIKETVSHTMGIITNEKEYVCDDGRFAPLWDSEDCKIDYIEGTVTFVSGSSGAASALSL